MVSPASTCATSSSPRFALPKAASRSPRTCWTSPGTRCHLVPGEVQQVRGERDAAFGRANRGEELVAHVEAGDTIGDGDVEGEDVDPVAHPGDGRTVGGDGEAGELGDGAGRRVIPGQPLWIEQSQGAGRDRNRLLHVDDAVGD